MLLPLKMSSNFQAPHVHAMATGSLTCQVWGSLHPGTSELAAQVSQQRKASSPPGLSQTPQACSPRFQPRARTKSQKEARGLKERSGTGIACSRGSQQSLVFRLSFSFFSAPFLRAQWSTGGQIRRESMPVGKPEKVVLPLQTVLPFPYATPASLHLLFLL